MKKILTFLLYYFVLLPISYLPFWLLYLLSSKIAFIFKYLFPYRKKVIDANLKIAFPELTDSERKKIRKQFYSFLGDLLVESIKNLTINEKELKKRIRIINPQILTNLYENNKSVLLVGAHYYNWEWLITGQQLLTQHQAVGIGMPLSNAFLNKKINAKRARFGMDIIDPKSVHEYFTNSTVPTCTLVLADQSPSNSKKSFWTSFFNSQTAFLFGTELLAHQYQQAVVYYSMKKIKRGYYEIHLDLITENPTKKAWGEISHAHIQLLEKQIKKNPYPWMWSHKRWKRELPENLNALKEEQRKSFNTKFNYEL